MPVKLERDTEKWFLVGWLTCVPFVLVFVLEEDPILYNPVKQISAYDSTNSRDAKGTFTHEQYSPICAGHQRPIGIPRVAGPFPSPEP